MSHMNKDTYRVIEEYMLDCMRDSAHDSQHIYRVIYHALDIASFESVDYEILLAACLLHDIGREAEFEDHTKSHAEIGAVMAFDFLRGIGWDEARARHVSDCIASHRFRTDNKPGTIEARILFDADKLEASGVTGLARVLIYKGEVSHPIYTLTPDGSVSDGSSRDDAPSFFHEYHYKMKRVYDSFHTSRAKEIATQRHDAAVSMYNSLLQEVRSTNEDGRRLLEEVLL